MKRTREEEEKMIGRRTMRKKNNGKDGEGRKEDRVGERRGGLEGRKEGG